MDLIFHTNIVNGHEKPLSGLIGQILPHFLPACKQTASAEIWPAEMCIVVLSFVVVKK